MEANFGILKLTATFRGDKIAPWSADKRGNWNYHVITVTNINPKKRTRFDYWASEHDPEVRNGLQLLNAFECFVSDAIAGADGFENFCAESRYDTDSRQVEKVWRTCQRARQKLRRLVFSDDDIYELERALQDEIGRQIDTEIEVG